jgi:hypothetical protein
VRERERERDFIPKAATTAILVLRLKWRKTITYDMRQRERASEKKGIKLPA